MDGKLPLPQGAIQVDRGIDRRTIQWAQFPATWSIGGKLSCVYCSLFSLIGCLSPQFYLLPLQTRSQHSRFDA